MHFKFPKAQKSWIVSHTPKFTKLSRQLISDKHWFTATQNMLIFEGTKENCLLKIKLCTPAMMHVENCVEFDDEYSLK